MDGGPCILPLLLYKVLHLRARLDCHTKPSDIMHLTKKSEQIFQFLGKINKPNRFKIQS